MYDYETQVQSKVGAIGTTDGNQPDPRKQSLSFKLNGQIILTPVWTQNNETLVQFQFQNAKMLTWYATKIGSAVDPTESKNPFFVYYGSSDIQLLSVEENSEILNFQRGLASIFNFREEDVEVDEIDVLGRCKTIYSQGHRLGLHKVKENCQAKIEPGQNVSLTRKSYLKIIVIKMINFFGYSGIPEPDSSRNP